MLCTAQKGRRSSAAAACTLDKGITVSTFGYGRISLVCADRYAAERAVILCYHVVLALRNSTFYVVVFLLVFHYETLLFYCFGILPVIIIDRKHRNIQVKYQ